MKKKIILCFLVLLCSPIINTNYHIENVGSVEKTVSIATVLIDDFANGTLGTKISLDNN